MVAQPHAKQLDLPLSTMCLDCEALKGKGRHAPPHANLVATSSIRQFSSSMGPADEQDYKCTVCHTEWMHETGSCGMGWL